MSIAGIKTATNTAAAVFAGSSVLSGRTQMTVQNLDDVMPITVGPTLSSGIVYGVQLEAGEKETFNFLSASTTAVYAQSLGRAVQIGVVEA